MKKYLNDLLDTYICNGQLTYDSLKHRVELFIRQCSLCQEEVTGVTSLFDNL
jgi:hypothetical protein